MATALPEREVNQFIYPLRKEFPLQAGKLKLPINPATGAADPDLAPIEAQEARNVVDGLALINHIKQTGNATYPFGKPKLPPTQNVAQAKVINDAVNRLLDIHDALADLALAESVHQVVQGNYDRAAATMDAYSRGNFPPIPDVVQTPRTRHHPHASRRTALRARLGLRHSVRRAEPA